MKNAMKIVVATEKDVEELEQLVELCFRGNLSKEGWTTEADMFEGPRITGSVLRKDFANSLNVTIFKCVTVDGEWQGLPSIIERDGKMIGCVRAERDGDKMKMGMISVHPTLQNQGLGKKLLERVEDFARSNGCTAVKMMVIKQRTELMAWYERQGYRWNGETCPVPVWEGQKTSGQKLPLDIHILEKAIVKK